MKDYYQILELSPDASQDEIQKQWRFLVQVWHPDKFANLDHKRRVEEKFKEITEAYEVLSHPQRRQAYKARRAEEEHQRKAQAERIEKERRKQEEAAHRRARAGKQHREQVIAASRRTEGARQRTAQAKSHVFSTWVRFMVFLLVWVLLIVCIYNWIV